MRPGVAIFPGAGAGRASLHGTWCCFILGAWYLRVQRERKVDTDVVVVQESGGGQNQQESGGACDQSDHRHFPRCAMIPR